MGTKIVITLENMNVATVRLNPYDPNQFRHNLHTSINGVLVDRRNMSYYADKYVKLQDLYHLYRKNRSLETLSKVKEQLKSVDIDTKYIDPSLLALESTITDLDNIILESINESYITTVKTRLKEHLSNLLLFKDTLREGIEDIEDILLRIMSYNKPVKIQPHCSFCTEYGLPLLSVLEEKTGEIFVTDSSGLILIPDVTNLLNKSTFTLYTNQITLDTKEYSMNAEDDKTYRMVDVVFSYTDIKPMLLTTDKVKQIVEGVGDIPMYVDRYINLLDTYTDIDSIHDAIIISQVMNLSLIDPIVKSISEIMNYDAR